MARPRTQRAPDKTDRIADAQVDGDALAQAGADAAEFSTRIAVVEQSYGIDIPYQLDVYIAAIRQRAAESAARLIEMGCLLLQVRERETGPVFANALERAGIDPRFARRAMQAAVKLQDRQAIRALGVTKALELLSEDDDTLDALDKGGTVAGLTLDEIDAMSTRELKAALRKERKERGDEEAAHEQIVAKKDERIHKLVREAKRVARSEAREKASEVLAQLDAAAVEVATYLKQMRDAITAVHAIYAEEGHAQLDTEVGERIDQNVQLASQWAQQIAEEFGA